MGGVIYCDGSASRSPCTPCNSDEYQGKLDAVLLPIPAVLTFGPWSDRRKGRKVGGGAPGRENTWAVVRAGGGYDYSLIYWGKELIKATGQVEWYNDSKSKVSNGVLQFRKGDLYDVNTLLIKI